VPVTSSDDVWVLVDAPVDAPVLSKLPGFAPDPSLTHSLNIFRMPLCDSLKMLVHLRPLHACQGRHRHAICVGTDELGSHFGLAMRTAIKPPLWYGVSKRRTRRRTTGATLERVLRHAAASEAEEV